MKIFLIRFGAGSRFDSMMDGESGHEHWNNKQHETNHLPDHRMGARPVDGCVTLSVYPYYNAEDVRFDPALLGVWVEPGKSEEKINEQAYRMTVSEKNEKTEFDARLSN